MGDEYFTAISDLNISIDYIREIPKNLLRVTNSRGMTLLLKACYNPMITRRMLEALIANGSYIKHTDNQGNNFLHSLCHNPNLHIELLKYALSLGFKVTDTNNIGETPLHIISRINGLYFGGLFAFLIRKKANVRAKTNNGCIPLLYFCENYSITADILSLYITAGAVIDTDIFIQILIQNNFDQVLLEYCIEFKDKKSNITHWLVYICKYKPQFINDRLMNVLYQKGSNINDCSLIHTPIYFLCSNFNSTSEQIKCLIRHGAIFKKYDNCYSSPYDILVYMRGQEFVDEILVSL